MLIGRLYFSSLIFSAYEIGGDILSKERNLMLPKMLATGHLTV